MTLIPGVTLSPGGVTTKFPTVPGELLDFYGNPIGEDAPSFIIPPPTGVNDTVATQNIINAAGALPGGGQVTFAPGSTYLVDYLTTVGSGGSQQLVCIAVPSNVTLVIPPTTIIRVVAANRANNAVIGSVICNANPDTGNVNVCIVGGGTIDGNRQNQGPLAYAPSGSKNVSRGVSIWATTGFRIDVNVANTSDIGVFIESTSTQGTVAPLKSTNCVGAFAVDSGTDITVASVLAVNSDAAYTINTTTNTNIPGGAPATVVPVSMAGIAVNTVLSIAIGSASYERVVVTAITPGVNFTAFFANAHPGPGTTIKNAHFASDSAVQCGNGAARVAMGLVVVDYANVQEPDNGNGVELWANCQDVTVAGVMVDGCALGLWIHGFTIAATHCHPERISIGAVVITNPAQTSFGTFGHGVFVDDNSYTLAADTIRDVTIASVSVRAGAGGAVVPNAAVGILVSSNLENVGFGVFSVEGVYTGVNLIGSQYVTFGSGTISNTQWQGVSVQKSAATGLGCVGNSFAALTIANPGKSGANGAGIIFFDTGSANHNTANSFTGLVITGVGAGFWPIDLSSGATNTGNTFIGDVSQNPNKGILLAGGTTNFTRLIGYSPVGTGFTTGTPAVAASGTAVLNYTGSDADVIISTGVGVTVTAINIGGQVTGITMAVSSVSPPIRLPAGQTITLTYAGGAPTWKWFGD